MTPAMYFAPLSVSRLAVSSKHYLLDGSLSVTAWLKI